MPLPEVADFLGLLGCLMENRNVPKMMFFSGTRRPLDIVYPAQTDMTLLFRGQQLWTKHMQLSPSLYCLHEIHNSHPKESKRHFILKPSHVTVARELLTSMSQHESSFTKALLQFYKRENGQMKAILRGMDGYLREAGCINMGEASL